jgi:hypothetical protein
MTYLSLGAGVQSSALLVMSALGLRGCPKAAVAVFADTQDEPAWVYQQLTILQDFGAAHGVPVDVVTVGRLSASAMVRIPAYVTNPAGVPGPLTQNCTRDYKRTPIRRYIRQRTRRPAVCLLGISVEEAHRAKDSGVRWLEHRYPLVELGMARSACVAVLEAHGIPVPRKSACVYCPWHSDGAWRELRDHDAEGFAAACAYDDQIRLERGASVHKSQVPLRLIDFGRNHPKLWDDGFGNDCSGQCGV